MKGFIWSSPGVGQGAGRRAGSFQAERSEADRLEVLIHRTKGKQKQSLDTGSKPENGD